MGWRQWTGAVLSALLVAAGGSAWAVDLEAHRGGRGLWPENTLRAFEGALRLGVTTLELDLGMTADGVVVVAHDQRLNPAFTRDAAGRWLAGPGPAIAELTLAQLQSYDVGRLQPDTPYARSFPAQQAVDGERIPTLSAVFALVQGMGAAQVRFDIETKLDPSWPDPRAEAFTAAVLAVIRQHGLQDRVTLQSFDWRTLRMAQRLAPGLPTSCLTAQRPNFDTVGAGKPEGSPWLAGLQLAQHGGSVPRLVQAAGCTVWSAAYLDLNEASVGEARALGLRVLAWTVNGAEDMDRLIGWRVDGLITDRPDIARTVMARRGLPLPAGVR